MKKIICSLMMVVLLCTLAFGLDGKVAYGEDVNLKKEKTSQEIFRAEDNIEEAFEDAVVLEEGVKVQGEILNSSDKNRYVFTPQETGSYRISSFGVMDTFAELYDENFERLTSDDDSGERNNFRIKMELVKGKKYYIAVKGFGDRTGVYEILVEKPEMSLIKGKIILPNGEKAPTGGLSVSVFAGGVGENITIPEGESQGEYVLEVDSGVNYAIMYMVSKDSGYFKSGYYNSRGTVIVSSQAEPVEVGKEDVAGIDIELIVAKKIFGKVKLLDSVSSAEEDIHLNVSLIYLNGKKEEWITSESVVIMSGSREVNYSLPVKENEKYKVSVRVNSNNNLIKKVYYNSNGTKLTQKGAEIIDVKSQDISNIDITLQEGKKISGSIKLPEDITGTTMNLDGIIELRMVDENFESISSSSFNIQVGEQSAEYEMTFLPNKRYVISYRFWSREGIPISEEGYYKSGEVVNSRSQAEIIETSNSDISGIDILVGKQVSIGGKVIIPDGVSQLNEDLKIRLSTYRRINDYFSRVNSIDLVIPQGEREVDYKIYGDKNSENTIYYRVLNSNNTNRIVSSGYYHPNKYIKDRDFAEKIKVQEEDVENININLQSFKVISGRVDLPNGKVAPEGGVEVRVSSDYFNDEYEWRRGESTLITINEGESGMDYSVPIEGDNIYKVSYRVENKNYKTGFYYHPEGNKERQFDGKRIEVQNSDVENIDVELEEVIAVTGEINILNKTENQNAFAEIGVFDAETLSNIGETIVSFYGNKSSAEYTVRLPKEYLGKEIIVGYSIQGRYLSYVRKGYFAGGDIVNIKENAEKVILRSEVTENINFNVSERLVDAPEIRLVLPDANEGARVDEILVKDENGHYVSYDLHLDGYKDPAAVISNGIVSVKGLEWDTYQEYKVFIDSNDNFYEYTLTSNDVGKDKVIDIENDYAEVTFDFNDIGEEFSIEKISVFRDYDGDLMHIGSIYRNKLNFVFSKGNYSFCIYGTKAGVSYIIAKEHIQIDRDKTISVNQNNLAKLSLNLVNHTERKIVMDNFYAFRFNHTRASEIGDRREIFLSRLDYRSVEVSLRNYEEANFEMRLNESNINRDMTINMDTRFKIRSNFANRAYNPGTRLRLKEVLDIEDSYGNKVDRISNAKIVLNMKKDGETKEIKVNSNSYFNMLTLPSEAGRYEVTISIDAGSFSCESEKMFITIEENELSELVEYYGSRLGDGSYSSDADKNNDGIIDILDFIKLSKEK